MLLGFCTFFLGMTYQSAEWFWVEFMRCRMCRILLHAGFKQLLQPAMRQFSIAVQENQQQQQWGWWRAEASLSILDDVQRVWVRCCKLVVFLDVLETNLPVLAASVSQCVRSSQSAVDS